MSAETPHSSHHHDLLLHRIMDRVAALVLLLTMMPVFVLIGLAIKLDSRGPVLEFYEGKRADDTRFTLYKFRTKWWHMPMNQTSTHHHMGLTRVGRFLRQTGIEELPMLINVLKGDLLFSGQPPRLFK